MILAIILFAGMQGQGQTPNNTILDCDYAKHGEPCIQVWKPSVAAKPEPRVQPARKVFDGYEPQGFGVCYWDDGHGHQTPCPLVKRWKYACADPERVLLTTESGKKLCVLFKDKQ